MPNDTTAKIIKTHAGQFVTVYGNKETGQWRVQPASMSRRADAINVDELILTNVSL